MTQTHNTTAEPLTISVVICAHNEQQWIEMPLNSLLKQRRPANEIIVVDNASTDNTVEVVQEFAKRHPEQPIRIVSEPNKGLFRARDTGWRAAQSTVVVSTDADITFPVDWLERIEQKFTNPTVNALTGSIRHDDALPIVNWITYWGETERYKLGRWHLNGGNSAIRRTVLEAVNGYTDKPHDAFEDQYLTKKLTDAGYHVEFLFDLKVYHSFRRFKQDGWWGYYNYLFRYTAENIYPDHLSDESPYKASVLIPTLNNAKTITACLNSLFAQEPRPKEIVIIDHSSIDDTVTLVQQYIEEHSAVESGISTKLICLNSTETPTLVDLVSGDIVIYVEADQLFPEQWLAKIHAAFICTPQLGAIGGEVHPSHLLSITGLSQILSNLHIRWRNRQNLTLGNRFVAYWHEVLKHETLKPSGTIKLPQPDVSSKHPIEGHKDQWIEALQALGYKVRFKPDIYVIRQSI